MRTRPFVYAALVLAFALPSSALAAVTVKTTSIQLPSGDVSAGSTLSVVCTAEGNSTTSMGVTTTTTIDRIDVTVSGGTVTPAQLTGAVSQPCSTAPSSTCSWLQGTVAWTTPAQPATLTVTCTVAYTNRRGTTTVIPGTVASSAPVTTVEGALPPTVGTVNGPDSVVVGATAAFDVTASDPNVPPRPITYAWTATGGTIAQDAANPAAASWQAPQQPGTYQVTVAVTAGGQTVQARKSVTVLLATYQAGLPVQVRAPRRLATDDAGVLFLVDGQQPTPGNVALLTVRGEARGFATLPEPSLAVAHGAGSLWVTTIAGNLYRLDARTGRVLEKVELDAGPFNRPTGIAFDAVNGTLWVADAGSDGVRVVRTDGTTLRWIATAGPANLLEPVDVAIDTAAGRAFVLVANAKKDSTLAVGEPVQAARFVHVYDLAGAYLASYVPFGGTPGTLSRGGGVAVSGGRVFLSDVFQGAVQVVTQTGAAVATIGQFGTIEGQLMNPTGLAVMANGDLAVANASLARVDRFGTGAALPSCAGDTDCDGLSDDYEITRGLDPDWAGDGLLDYDADGLLNLEEFALATDPRNHDTDGDGYGDGDEDRGRFDPLDPLDHHVRVVQGAGPLDVPPGLVRLSSTLVGPAGCGVPAVRWAQAAGPQVALSGATTTTPSFVARTPGAYDFDGVPECGTAPAAPARVRVNVRNVPPLADAGRVVVAAAGTPVRLDALFSSDANGDGLSYEWDQTFGRPLAGGETGAALVLRPRGPGLYRFMLTAKDPKGAAATAEVPVLVASPSTSTAIAAAFPAEAQVGQTVSLDATASLVTDDSPAFSWEQLSGPAAVTLAGADQPVATFSPPSAGRYVFAASVVAANGQRSPPARVEVYVADEGAALPVVESATADESVVAVGSAVGLAAAGTGATFAWTQVSGPAAGLTDADRAGATVVPFAPGFHVFEVVARSGAAVSRPRRVAFEARAGGKAIPVARAEVPGLAPIVGQLVFLDGRKSTGAVRWRWTQVEGAWVVLSGQTSVATFRPPAPGRYVFELEVDDGSVRSAPERVEVVVSEQGVQ